MAGMLLLNGGDEFHAGNEPQDRALAAARGPGPALVVTTAAARGNPGLAFRTARAWFGGLGLEVEELPILGRADAAGPLAERARGAGLLYLVGGDPGLVVQVLSGTPAWRAMVEAWAGGAALAGSSAGAMALCEWTLVRARFQDRKRRRAAPALGLVPGIAVLPHFDTYGHRWAVEAPPGGVTFLGPDERTAAVWEEGRWRVLGAGTISVIGGQGRTAFGPGQEVAGLPDPDPARVLSRG